MRRQRWLARLQAGEFVSALASALSGEGAPAGKAQVSASGRRYREVPLEGLMAQMGAKWT